MSQAFIREGDDMWLQDVGPSLPALLNFLSKENNGVRVYVQSTSSTEDGRDIFKMSNGLSYARNQKGEWEVI